MRIKERPIHMKTETLATESSREAAKGLIRAKNEYIVEEIRSTDWREHQYLDIVFATNYAPVDNPLSSTKPSEVFTMGLKAMAIRYRDDPPGYDWYDRLYDTMPEVFRINEEFADEVLSEWD